MSKTLRDSLSYKPVELSFGTSGLRGLVSDMTDLECYINTLGFINYLEAHDNLKTNSEIIIAGDLRDSTPRIMAAVTKAITDGGHKVLNCGLIPTPAAAHFGLKRNTPCVVITGSHIPADRNGIKYYKKEGEVLKSDEAPIRKSVVNIRRKLYEQSSETALFDNLGAIQEKIEIPSSNSEASKLYIRRYAQTFDDEPLKGKQVVVYQHSAVGRDMLVDILKSLGADATSFGRSKTFIPIDSENVTPENKVLFKEIAKKHPNNFAIVSTDGDSDRPFIIDESGEFYRGDIVGGIIASYLNADFAAFPISSNDAVDKFCQAHNIKVVHTKIGSPYVVNAMEEGQKNHKTVVGWEVNGGFLTGTDIIINGHNFTALPTRDAVLPIISVLITAVWANQKVSELFSTLPKRYTGGGLIEGVKPEKMKNFLVALRDDSVNEAYTASVFKDFGAIKSINTLDGLRIVFASNDVIHIRPSNNAPQLRIYTNTNSQKRADEIVAQAVAKKGLLWQFIDKF